jgi:hypothetical protein
LGGLKQIKDWLSNSSFFSLFTFVLFRLLGFWLWGNGGGNFRGFNNVLFRLETLVLLE